jgi:hypothetical protein
MHAHHASEDGAWVVNQCMTQATPNPDSLVLVSQEKPDTHGKHMHMLGTT